MRRIRAALFCLVGLAALPMPALQAQNPVGLPPAGDASGTAVVAPTQDVLGTASYTGSAPVGPFGGYLFFRKDIGQGVGYDEGFSTLGWFQPIQVSEHGIAFAQGQFMISDDGDVGGSLGGGYRHYFPSIDRLFGAWAFYDADESARGIDYDQFGFGVETRGRRWDASANVYAPLSKDTHFQGVASPFAAIPSFVQHNLLFNGSAYFEKAMPGADVEFGIPIFDPSAFGRLRAYFGAYVYDSEEKNPAGVRARLESHLNEYFTIGASFLHDDIHGGQATLAVDIRAWSKKLPPITNHRPTQEPKLYLPVVRQYRIATDVFIDEFTALALGNDGEPLDFVWVDNSNPNAGDGTFEDPFHDMPSSAGGADYILVRRGASSTGNPVLGGIVLEDNQIMVGEGLRFGIDIAGTKFGNVALAGSVDIDDIYPDWDTTGGHPFVRNPVGSAVTLADDNQVGGLNIISSSGDGISGTGIRDFRLFNLNIGHGNPAFGNTGAGIALTNVSGVGIVENVTLFNNTAGGLVVDNTSTAPLQLFVNSDSAIDPNAGGGAVALSLRANNSDITADIENFLADGSGTGMFLRADNGGSLDVMAETSEFNNTTSGDGIQVVAASGATVSMNLFEVFAIGANRHGLNVDVNNALFIGAVDASPVGASSFSLAGQDGVHVSAFNAPNAGNLLSLNRTLVNFSGADGIHVELANGSNFGVQFVDGQIFGSGGDAVDTVLDGLSTLDLFVDPSLLSDSDLNGFRFEILNASVLNATFDDVIIANSGVAGVPGEANGVLGILDSTGAGGSVANLNFTNTTIDESDEMGIRLELNDLSTVNLDFDTVSVSNSGLHGVGATVLNGSTLAGTLVDTFIFDNGQDLVPGLHNGVDFFVDGANVDLDFGVAIANTGGNTSQLHGLRFEAINGSILNLNAIGGSSVVNSGDGVFGLVDDSMATLFFENLNLNSGSGLNLTAQNGATVSVQVESEARENGEDGIELLATGPGTSVTFTALGVAAEDNVINGFELIVQDGALLDATVQESFGSGNGADGFHLTAIDAGTIARLEMIAQDTLSMIGGNAFDDNDGAGVRINAMNVDEIDAIVSGSASDNGADGVQFNITNVNDTANTPIAARVGVIGAGLISDNMGNGVLFDIDNSTINSDVGDFGLIVADLNIFGVTNLSISDNLASGVFVNVTDSVIVDNGSLAVPTFLISGARIDDNLNGQGIHVRLDNVVVPSNEIAIEDNVSISDNDQDGILFTLLGTSLDGLSITDNAGIDDNGGDGIDINSDVLVTNLTIDDNVVDDNSELGINLTNAAMTGVLVTDNFIRGNLLGGVRVGGDGPKEIEIEDNTITGNNGDGVRIVNNAQSGANAYDIIVTDNTISNNGGRGVNILNQGTADSSIELSFNLINGNTREAIYVVNTSSTTQSANFGAALLANGAFDAIPRLQLVVETNIMLNNGAAAAQTALGHGGLVIRVGTSDAGTDHTDDGGFASTGGPFAPMPDRGGVIALVSDNFFDENVGADVFIHSFVSTAPPPATTGTWDNVTFNVMTYRSDPLARLDLNFTGNIGDEALVTNLGAAYNNSEPVFKSRDGAQTDAGPFTSATRRRNAQRLAFRGMNVFGDFTNPTTPGGASDAFLYPGVGGSTFRFGPGSDTGGFAAGNNFSTTVPFGTPIFGEAPFGWDAW